MSEFIKNQPSAIEVFLFYKRGKGESATYERLCKMIGKNTIAEEEFKRLFDKIKITRKRDIGQLVANNQANLRICILSDVIDKKSIIESFLSITKLIGTIGTRDIDDQDFEFWFNRFSSENWNLDQKTLSDMPVEVIGNVAEYLNFESRMRLRRVSHGLQNIVDHVNSSVDDIFYTFNRQDWENVAYFGYSKGNERLPSVRCIYTGEDFLERAFNDMKILLSNPRLQLKFFDWYNELSREYDEKLIDVLNSLNHKLEISTLKVFSSDEVLSMELLKTTKPGTLETITFVGKSEHINQLVQLDQWKKAKDVYFSTVIPDFFHHIHHFLHFETVDVNAESVSIDDILLLKKSFIERETLDSFAITTKNKPENEQIREALGLPDPHNDDFLWERIDIPGSTDYVNVSISELNISFWRNAGKVVK